MTCDWYFPLASPSPLTRVTWKYIYFGTSVSCVCILRARSTIYCRKYSFCGGQRFSTTLALMRVKWQLGGARTTMRDDNRLCLRSRKLGKILTRRVSSFVYFLVAFFGSWRLRQIAALVNREKLCLFLENNNKKRSVSCDLKGVYNGTAREREREGLHVESVGFTSGRAIST